jgi:hypothetical protein
MRKHSIGVVLLMWHAVVLGIEIEQNEAFGGDI